MGSVGDAYDNAMAESFFASLECELIDRRTFKTKTEARLALFTYIEGWYNPRRRHSALGYRSPANFESRGFAGPPAVVLEWLGQLEWPFWTSPVSVDTYGLGGFLLHLLLFQYQLLVVVR